MCREQSNNYGCVGLFYYHTHCCWLFIYVHFDRDFGPDHFIESQRVQVSVLIVVHAVFSSTSFDRTAQLANSTNNFRPLQLVEIPVTTSAKWPTVSQVRVIADSYYFLVQTLFIWQNCIFMWTNSRFTVKRTERKQRQPAIHTIQRKRRVQVQWKPIETNRVADQGKIDQKINEEIEGTRIGRSMETFANLRQPNSLPLLFLAFPFKLFAVFKRFNK